MNQDSGRMDPLIDPSADQASSASRHLLSVVIIGRNEGARLADCLESVKRIQGVPVKEIIYVDSGSTDQSLDVARQHGATILALEADRPTAASGRNAGWRHCSTELVLFLDGDTVVHEAFPSLASQALDQDASVAAAWGHRRETHPERSIYNRVLDLDWIYPPGPSAFCGGDALMRRDILERVGGYDDALIAGEEPELCARIRALGFCILHVDAPMTGHDLHITSFSQYWRRAKRTGHAYAEVSARFRNTSNPLWTSVRRRNLWMGGFWIGSFAVALLATAWLHLALVLWFAMVLVLSVRSAYKVRWKGGTARTLALYGVHSQLQQVPICMGQLEYSLRRRLRKERGLIEYKGTS